jgi:hypothetical protein
MKCLFCDNESEKGSEICKDCRELFEQECVESEYPICGKCGTYEAECGCN